jgi:hypothetical protein
MCEQPLGQTTMGLIYGEHRCWQGLVYLVHILRSAQSGSVLLLTHTAGMVCTNASQMGVDLGTPQTLSYAAAVTNCNHDLHLA